ncbi:unnamed protein product [Medioppia subpectinata]|uniref:VWFA domain-containing protein n=1 Tax=Medioppia subpectinata TaxID=1979941 RepID=A0A7R9KE40_9ACAR|nr:unnamed protein product [Medioppia subpectinata]CAG2101688.1 unnamed protein product [Medioppia subpectinata]
MAQTVVFVLDVSGSMYGPPCESLQMAAWRYIDDAPDNQRLGIVLFDDQAWTAHPVVQITGPDVRARLRQAVPQMDRGTTDIGKGLLQGLQALRLANPVTEGAVIFLVTDGDNNYPDYVDQVLHVLQAAKVIVRCLAIGRDADRNLDRLADATGGNVSFLPDVGPESREMAERVMSAAMQEVKVSREMAEVVVIGIYNDIVTLNEGSNHTVVQVPIDPDIGRNTSVQVLSHDIGSLIITFESPAGAMADQFVMDDSLKRARLNVRQCAPGVWRLLLTKQPGVIRKAIRAQVVVESEMSGTGSGSAIELYVGIRGQEANCPPLLVCRLDKAGGPVLGAHLTATVDRPDGTQTHTPLDRYHTDGYYYNYFTDYCGAGRYNVSVLAVNDGPNTTFQDNELGEFRRQRVAHSFQLRQDLPAVPPDDHLFDQLVANGTFAHLKQRDTSVQFVELDHSHPTPAAPVAALPSRPPISREMAAKRGTLSVEYIKMKKAIRNSTLSESDKLTKLDELSDFNKYLTSTRDTNDDEIDSYRRRLVDIRNTL